VAAGPFKKRAAVVVMYVAQKMGFEEDDRRFMRGKALSSFPVRLEFGLHSPRRTTQKMGGKRQMPAEPNWF
jgi:hypothetical protein